MRTELNRFGGKDDSIQAFIVSTGYMHCDVVARLAWQLRKVVNYSLRVVQLIIRNDVTSLCINHQPAPASPDSVLQTTGTAECLLLLMAEEIAHSFGPRPCTLFCL